ncbi:beta-1,4-galactosyltransferase 4-like isoform X2 [Crassostrea angulata]|uniref:beta-1,4-galactosyltransferase 4-like isoform X2 n=1 Tax=Magallana angulata TaxID=2784310 RepID=UPI0022B0FA46|nr:beta-1,4-galactosyltransferase 4-like isoform X2 [Crassostrea angulata]
MTTETKKLFFIVVILQVLFLCMWLFSMGCYSNGSISKMMEMMESKRSRLKLGQGILDAAADLEKENAEKSKPLCPLIPNGLVGNRKVNKTPPTLEDMERNYSLIQNGQYKPKNCKSRQNVAVLIPFRDRESHLRIFLNHMHPFLMRQQLQYGIYVVEQTKELKFNRGILFNIGFKEASNDSNYDCFILHDVDLLPENDFNIYSCPADHPKHLSVAIDKLNYKLPYPTNFGGVTAVTKEQFEAINGFSNIFYGWGGEDDDLYNRVKWAKMSANQAINRTGRYSSLRHKDAVKNPNRSRILKSGKSRMWKDGLNSLKYKVIQKMYKKLYVHITVKPCENNSVCQQGS